MKTVIKILSVLLTVFTVSAQPYTNYVIPCGVQKGQELDITVTGKGLQNVENAVFYEDGIQFLKIVETKKNQVKFKIKVDKDCKLGLKHFRLYSKDNFSEIISLSVGQFPSRVEKEDNGSIEKAEEATKNITIDGIIKREDIDYFKITLQKGENLKLEVEANRLSHRTNSSRTAEYFDTHLGIYNKEGFLLVDKDDTPLTKLDPHLEFIAPE
ncbi:MAG: hypothetical protein NE330_00430, partial [Lentisphaeraceae bacterium]|nr:hypothetical protein [Lentisphaeraceae bacterium]